MKTLLQALSMLLAAPVATWPAEAPAARLPEATPELAATGRGHIKVAFVLTDGAVIIDFGGPWEVFETVHIPSRGPDMNDQMPFQLYTVSDTRRPIRASGGMQVVPDYTFEDAPPPGVVVVPAQGGDSALHVVELYFGRDVAGQAARYMEYEGKGWMGDGSASTSFAGK